MSFGPSAAAQQGMNTLGQNASVAAGQAPNIFGTGTNAIAQGGSNINSGTNFLNTILNGNQANTTAMLQPSIDQIRQGNQQNLQQASTLMPRGGGRSGALFNLSTQPQQQVQNLFNGARTTAATTLPQIGLQQQGVGANIFGLGSNLLNTSNSGAANQAQLATQQQQISNQLLGGLGSGLFGLATLPVSGGGTLFSNLFNS